MKIDATKNERSILYMMTMKTNDRTKNKIVRQLFDLDSNVYTDERYPKNVRTSGEYSYLMRKYLCFEMVGNLDRGSVLLEIGCGPGIYTRNLIRLGMKVLAIDLSWKMLVEAKGEVAGENNRKCVDFFQAEATRIPIKPLSIDAVLCVGVLAYVDDVSDTLREIYKVLKPGGIGILQMSNKYSPVEIENCIIKYIKKQRRVKQCEKTILLEDANLLAISPKRFKVLCNEAGFHEVECCYYGFRSRILEFISQKIAFEIAKKFAVFARSKVFGRLGEGYLVKVMKR